MKHGLLLVYLRESESESEEEEEHESVPYNEPSVQTNK